MYIYIYYIICTNLLRAQPMNEVGFVDFTSPATRCRHVFEG